MGVDDAGSFLVVILLQGIPLHVPALEHRCQVLEVGVFPLGLAVEQHARLGRLGDLFCHADGEVLHALDAADDLGIGYVG